MFVFVSLISVYICVSEREIDLLLILLIFHDCNDVLLFGVSGLGEENEKNMKQYERRRASYAFGKDVNFTWK